jgi:hypothetical protein
VCCACAVCSERVSSVRSARATHNTRMAEAYQ